MNIYEFTAQGDGNVGAEYTAPDHWKRAVYRAAPKRFSIQMLSPQKQGGTIHHGMRICPIIRSSSSSRSSAASISSAGSNSEYDIFRKWEDCLWLQETVEQEYTKLAREKRQRLLAGKGVKSKQGFYKQDKASSFESLPPGPDPHSVAKDIHEHVPKLTKKGTFFKASAGTIEQRQRELGAFVQVLFSDDVPTLVADIRNDRLVMDFFGYWRRDVDIAGKAEKERARANSDASTTSAGRGSFSLNRLTGGSSPSTKSSLSVASASDAGSFRSVSPSPSSGTQRRLRVPHSAGAPRPSSIGEISNNSRVPHSAGPRLGSSLSRRRTHSSASSGSGSSSSSSLHSSNGSVTTLNTLTGGPAVINTQEVPVVFNHNPHDSTLNGLEALPEDGELRSRSRSKSSKPHNVRESWQTTSSASTYLDGLNVHMPGERNNSNRMSVATMMTTNSAEAVIPRDFNPDSYRRRGAADRPESVSSTWTAQTDEFVDSYLYDSFPLPPFVLSPTPEPDSRPETPQGFYANQHRGATQSVDRLSVFSTASTATTTGVSPSPSESTASLATFVTADTSLLSRPPSAASHYYHPHQHQQHSQQPHPHPHHPQPPHIQIQTHHTGGSASPTSMSPTSGGSPLYIKVAHGSTIVIMRAYRGISLADMRRRIFDKLVGQEGASLSDSFALALIIPGDMLGAGAAGRGRSRSNSASSAVSAASGGGAGGTGVSMNEHGGSQMKFISSQRDWELAMLTVGGKLNIRVLDTLSN